MDWVIESVKEAEEEFNLMTRLIVSVNRHEGVEEAVDVVEHAMACVDRGIVGVGIAGNEAEYSAEPFADLFADARKAGLRVTIHAGEWSGPHNVAEAINILRAERIGHGIRILEDPEVVELAREEGTTFEVCVTSNHHSGVVEKIEEHPFTSMLMQGLDVTINTDDPSISRITLSDEYRVVTEVLGIPLGVLRERVLAAAKASFLSPAEKAKLVQSVSNEFTERMLELE
jgi:adenosine deaminase